MALERAQKVVDDWKAEWSLEDSDDANREWRDRVNTSLVEHIAAALSQDWQPIETAPAGRDVLLYRANGKYFIDDYSRYAKYNAPVFTHWAELHPPEVKE